MHFFKNRWIWYTTFIAAFGVPLVFFVQSIFQAREFFAATKGAGVFISNLFITIPALGTTLGGNAAWVALGILGGTIGFLLSSFVVWLFWITKTRSQN